MKKRLRKKLHKGEYQELGFGIEGEFIDNFNADKFLDDFIEFCENNNLQCGGGNNCEFFDFFVTLQGRGSVTEDLKKKVKEWLINHKFVKSVKVGKLVDAWYVKFEDIME
jgi:uncharacterized protein YggL (DUF469 family)